ncbi:3354_t:CDS:2, partial [Rhizophagus irregularis]
MYFTNPFTIGKKGVKARSCFSYLDFLRRPMPHNCSKCNQCKIDKLPCQPCIQERYQKEYENWSCGNEKIDKLVSRNDEEAKQFEEADDEKSKEDRRYRAKIYNPPPKPQEPSAEVDDDQDRELPDIDDELLDDNNDSPDDISKESQDDSKELPDGISKELPD